MTLANVAVLLAALVVVISTKTVSEIYIYQWKDELEILYFRNLDYFLAIKKFGLKMHVLCKHLYENT